MRSHQKSHRQVQMWNPGAFEPLKETKKQKDFCSQRQSHQKCQTKLLCQLGQNTTVTDPMAQIQMENNPPTVATVKSQPHVSKWSIR